MRCADIKASVKTTNEIYRLKTTNEKGGKKNGKAY